MTDLVEADMDMPAAEFFLNMARELYKRGADETMANPVVMTETPEGDRVAIVFTVQLFAVVPEEQLETAMNVLHGASPDILADTLDDDDDDGESADTPILQ